MFINVNLCLKYVYCQNSKICKFVIKFFKGLLQNREDKVFIFLISFCIEFFECWVVFFVFREIRFKYDYYFIIFYRVMIFFNCNKLNVVVIIRNNEDQYYVLYNFYVFEIILDVLYVFKMIL